MDNNSVVEFFGNLNLTILPTNVAEYIKTQIISDNDISLIADDDEDFIEVKNFIEENYPLAIAKSGEVEPAIEQPATPAEPIVEEPVIEEPKPKTIAEQISEIEGLIGGYKLKMGRAKGEDKGRYKDTIAGFELKLKRLKAKKESGGDVIVATTSYSRPEDKQIPNSEVIDFSLSSNDPSHMADGGTVGEFEVEVEAEPNPDFPRSSHRGSVKIKQHRIKADSLKDLKLKYFDFTDENQLGSGNISDSAVYESGNKIGHFSYNGRLWGNDGKEILIDEPDKLADGGEIGKYRIRQDLLKKGEGVPVGNQYIKDGGEYEGKYKDDKFFIKINNKWHKAESIDWDYVPNSLKIIFHERYGDGGSIPHVYDSDSYEEARVAIEGEFNNAKLEAAPTAEDIKYLASIIHKMKDDEVDLRSIMTSDKVQDYLTNLAAKYEKKVSENMDSPEFAKTHREWEAQVANDSIPHIDDMVDTRGWTVYARSGRDGKSEKGFNKLAKKADEFNKGKDFVAIITEDGEQYYLRTKEAKSETDEKRVYEHGGGFEKLAHHVAHAYEGQKVPKKYQFEYGKVYNKETAAEVGRKVAAKVYREQQSH